MIDCKQKFEECSFTLRNIVLAVHSGMDL